MGYNYYRNMRKHQISGTFERSEIFNWKSNTWYIIKPKDRYLFIYRNIVRLCLKKHLRLFSWLKSSAIGLALCFSLLVSSYAQAPKFHMVLYYVGQMVLDPGVSINDITDHQEYVQFKGVAPSQMSAYLLAKNLLKSRLQQEFKFTDIVPFWDKGKFTFILTKDLLNRPKETFVQIEQPSKREILKGLILLSGSCSREGAEVVVSGDLIGRTTCKTNKWQISFPPFSNKKLPIIGIRVTQLMVNQKIVADHRSFNLSRP